MRYELIQLYVKDNNRLVYDYIESHYQGRLKEQAYELYGIYIGKKQVKKYIQKLLKNT